MVILSSILEVTLLDNLKDMSKPLHGKNVFATQISSQNRFVTRSRSLLKQISLSTETELFKYIIKYK